MNAPVLPPVILTDVKQDKETFIALEDVAALTEHLEKMPEVKTEDEASLVSEYRTKLRSLAKVLNDRRLAITKPLRDHVSMLNQAANQQIERAERAVKLADNLLLPYMREQKRKRDEAEAEARRQREEEERLRREEQEALERAQRAAEETKSAKELKDAEAAAMQARAKLNELGTRTRDVVVPPKSVTGDHGSKTQLREVWKYRVTDISKVPEEYLVDPEDRVKKAALNAIAKRDKDMASVPGIEFYAEETLSSRASGAA